MQIQMFPAIVNSPITTLSTGIDSSVTTISITDISKVPVAPNLLTISGGENAETIKYTGISGNDLTGCTRGFQGIAQPWNMGVSVMRAFTAYDHDTFKNNIEDHVGNTTTPHGADTASTANKIALRDASGNLTAKQIISDIAQGTAPMQVTSTTKVANLNVEQVDGHDAGTSADNVLVLDGSGLVPVGNVPNLSWNKITTDKPTTISGYGITDAYTKTEIDNKTGTLSALTTTSKIIAPAINEIKASVDAINATNQTQPLTIPHGLSIATTDRKTPINALAFTGRTLINLLGRDGNCEDVSKWGAWQSTLSLDTTNYSCGINSIKMTLTGTNSTMNRPVTAWDVTKYYLAIAGIKNGNTAGAYILKETTGGGVSRQGQAITDATKFSNSYIKLQPTDLAVGNILMVGVVGTTTQYLNVDGIRLHQIDQATYNLIDVDPEYTGDKLAEKYPYVDSYQVLQNPSVVVQGKNFLPPFSQWTLQNSAVQTITSPYTLQYSTPTAYLTAYSTVPVITGQTYTISVTKSDLVNARIVVYGGIGLTGSVISGGIAGSYTFTATIACGGYVTITVDNGNTTSGITTFTNPMLNLGSTALPFEPADPSYKYFPCKLADGETLQEIDGQWVLTRKIKDVVLDGSLGWVIHAGGTGVKQVKVDSLLPNNTVGTKKAVKYDGKIMYSSVGPLSTGDQVFDDSGSTLYLSVFNVDSGWGDAYTPTADEIKAYFYGWVMYKGEDNTLYEGTTGTKSWYKRYCGIGTKGTLAFGADVVVGTQVTVCPTVINDQGFTPYQLHYTLATPTTEIIQPEGSLELHDGLNQVELSEGIVVRESVIPKSDGINYFIGVDGNVYPPGKSETKYRNNKFITIFRDGELDFLWSIILDAAAYGKYIARIPPTLYDPAASYSVTYEVLDEYLFTTNALTATGTYDTNDHTVLGHTVEKVSEVETKVSVVERGKANKNQMSWIAPTLLNGWVNLGGVTATSGYYKDEFGLVRLRGYIKSGITTQGTILFTLPLGYRPAATEGFMVYANDGASIGTISISSGGNVAFITGSSLDMSLSGVSFRAEQ